MRRHEACRPSLLIDASVHATLSLPTRRTLVDIPIDLRFAASSFALAWSVAVRPVGWIADFDISLMHRLPAPGQPLADDLAMSLSREVVSNPPPLAKAEGAQQAT
jgi:hypothetical protein